MIIKRQDIVAAARSFLDVPFKKGGRSAYGMDCIGLLLLSGQAVGLELEDTTRYTFEPEVQILTDYVYRQSVRLDPLPIMNGSIAILKQSAFPMHTGIMCRDGARTTIINANIRKRKVVEQPFSEWVSNLIMFRDYLGELV